MKKKKEIRAEKNWAEKLLCVILWPFKIALKAVWFVVKFIFKTVLMAPITIILWVAIIFGILLLVF